MNFLIPLFMFSFIFSFCTSYPGPWWILCLQIFCIFMMACAACVFGLILGELQASLEIVYIFMMACAACVFGLILGELQASLENVYSCHKLWFQVCVPIPFAESESLTPSGLQPLVHMLNQHKFNLSIICSTSISPNANPTTCVRMSQKTLLLIVSVLVR